MSRALSVPQAAKRAGRHQSTVYRAIHRGHLEAHLEEGCWRVYSANVCRWAARAVAVDAMWARKLYEQEGSLRAVACRMHVGKATVRRLIVCAGGVIKPPPRRGNWDAYCFDVSAPARPLEDVKIRNPDFLCWKEHAERERAERETPGELRGGKGER